MNYGYQLAASGVMTAMFRQDVAANNLANVETVGFKPDSSFTIPREAARVEDRLLDMPSNKLLERLGAGVLLAPTRTAFKQGALTRTSNPLDVGIEGDGFLAISARGDSNSGQQIRLTRDGRLTLNSKGELVTVTGGNNVLDESGRPISLAPDETVDIGADGVITQGGAEVAKIGLVNVANKSQLRKVGHNLFAAPSTVLDSPSARDGMGELVQGHVEQSSVDAIQAMMDVQNAANAVTGATRLMSIHDEMTGRLINSLGRVSA